MMMRMMRSFRTLQKTRTAMMTRTLLNSKRKKKNSPEKKINHPKSWNCVSLQESPNLNKEFRNTLGATSYKQLPFRTKANCPPRPTPSKPNPKLSCRYAKTQNRTKNNPPPNSFKTNGPKLTNPLNKNRPLAGNYSSRNWPARLKSLPKNPPFDSVSHPNSLISHIKNVFVS